MVNVKTPNKKRKSLSTGGESDNAVSPKGNNPRTPQKTPGKPNVTPAKGNKTPNKQNNVKTPKPAVGQTTADSPKPVKNQQQTPGKKNVNKRGNESQTEATPSKKLKKFGGTSELQTEASPQKTAQQKVKTENRLNIEKKRKAQYLKLKEKVKNGDKSVADELRAKIKVFLDRKELTKTGKRKLKFLQRMLRHLTGELPEVKPPSDSKKRRERKKEAIKKYGVGEEKGQLRTQKKLKQVKQEEDEDSDESDYEVESEINPDKIIKTTGDEESDDDEDEDDDEEGEEEEESDDEGEGEESENDDEEGGEEESEEEEEPKPVANQKGGKKKNQEKKNEVKAKNFKLQAMRNQGQLAGSVKQSQKRSARRAKKNAGAVNGSN